MKRVMVTGANGFVGRHLCRELEDHGYSVFRVGRSAQLGPIDMSVELTAPDQVRSAVKEARPDHIVHLAGFASVGASWRQPTEAMTVNVIGSSILFEAIAEHAPDALVLSVGSGEEYGSVESGECSEELSANPLNPYGISKLAQGLLAIQLQRRKMINAIHVRAFNHTGPGQPQGFVIPDWASRIVRMERGDSPPVMVVGSLDVVRDFLDVRDVVRAYRALLEYGRPGKVYNVSSGSGQPLAAVLEIMRGLARVSFTVEKDAALVRPAEVPVLIGNASRLRRDTGWSPSFSLEQTLADVIDYWRKV